MVKKKETAPQNFDLYKEIKSEKLYKSNVENRDNKSRKYIEEQCGTTRPNEALLIGNMVYFDYFEPKLKEELEYYDAKPVVLIFGRFMTSLGKRVLGFNIHYYPPRMRYRILSRICEIFRDELLKNGWENGQQKDMNKVDYRQLLTQLEKAKLTFGVREYDPELMNKVRIVPPKEFSKVVFTEGAFKKRTRTMIMNYWKQYKQN